MSYKFECPNCGLFATVEEAMIGKRRQCEYCGETVVVPGTDAAGEGGDAGQPQAEPPPKPQLRIPPTAGNASAIGSQKPEPRKPPKPSLVRDKSQVAPQLAETAAIPGVSSDQTASVPSSAGVASDDEELIPMMNAPAQKKPELKMVESSTEPRRPLKPPMAKKAGAANVEDNQQVGSGNGGAETSPPSTASKQKHRRHRQRLQVSPGMLGLVLGCFGVIVVVGLVAWLGFLLFSRQSSDEPFKDIPIEENQNDTSGQLLEEDRSAP